MVPGHEDRCSNSQRHRNERAAGLLTPCDPRIASHTARARRCPMPVGTGTGQARQTKTQSGRSKAQDAIKLLKADHDEVEELFAQYEKQKKKGDTDKAELIDKICTALTVHAQIEEEIFYPAARNALEED